MHLLLIDDDTLVADPVRSALVDNGYTVDVARDASSGRELAISNGYDAILVDIMPERGGLDFLAELRRHGATAPIIVLAATETRADEVQALDAGADDFLRRTVTSEVLAARLRAAIRRGGPRLTEHLHVGNLLLNRVSHNVQCASRPLLLTARQYALLEFLALHENDIVGRPVLLEHVWQLETESGSNVVDVHVAQLRKRLRDAGSTVDIRTVRGEGYVLQVGTH